MAGIDVAGGGRGKRAMNADINMIPFIDLLMVTVAFLLITAVWVTNSQLKANANVPGPPLTHPQPGTTEKILDVSVEQDRFVVAWKIGPDIVSTKTIDRPADDARGAHYEDLAKAIEADWRMHGSHTQAADQRLDVAVLHTDNATPFKEIAAVMDAIYATRRDIARGDDGRVARGPAFDVTFAAR